METSTRIDSVEDLADEEEILKELGWDLDSLDYLNTLEAQLLHNVIVLHKRTRSLERQLWQVRSGNSRDCF